MKLGFTGTRKGMTEAQEHEFVNGIDKLDNLSSFHHGGADGADYHAAWLVKNNSEASIVGYPATKKIPLNHILDDVIHKPKPPLDRNKDIVNACDLLIACPAGFEEELRSGTWATIRYAKKIGRPVIIIYPDGKMERFNVT